MEFPFNVNDVLPSKITKIGSSLLPEGFVGDRRRVWDCVDKVAEILDDIGKASAKAQGLQKPITSGEKMRNTDYTVYVLVDPEGAHGKGAVVGLLKVGRKKLFVFDSSGAHKEVQPLCILDFYIHESMQRKGLGKVLYEHMLQEEGVQPKHLAVDKPSEKFLSFLLKHYGLHKIVPQNNNFVVYDEFFDNNPDLTPRGRHTCSQMDKGSASGLITNRRVEASGTCRTSPYFGRHAAHKPESTLGKIIQNCPPGGELKRVASDGICPSDGIGPSNLRCGEMARLSGSFPDLHKESHRNEQQHSQLW